MDFLVPILFAFIAGYFFAAVVLYGITVLVVACVAYIWWVVPFEGLAALIPMYYTVVGTVFLLAMWVTAALARWNKTKRVLQVIKTKVIRG